MKSLSALLGRCLRRLGQCSGMTPDPRDMWVRPGIGHSLVAVRCVQRQLRGPELRRTCANPAEGNRPPALRLQQDQVVVQDRTRRVRIPPHGNRTRVLPLVPPRPRLQTRASQGVRQRVRRGYFRPITMESGPTRCSVRVVLNPASVIHPTQSAAV